MTADQVRQPHRYDIRLLYPLPPDPAWRYTLPPPQPGPTHDSHRTRKEARAAQEGDVGVGE